MEPTNCRSFSNSVTCVWSGPGYQQLGCPLNDIPYTVMPLNTRVSKVSQLYWNHSWTLLPGSSCACLGGEVMSQARSWQVTASRNAAFSSFSPKLWVRRLGMVFISTWGTAAAPPGL